MGVLPDDWTLPAPNDLTREWFTSASIAVQTCAGCGTRQHPPEEICHRCGGMEFGHTRLGTTGKVYSYTVAHYPVNRALADSVPYAVVLVALDDDGRAVGQRDRHGHDLAVEPSGLDGRCGSRLALRREGILLDATDTEPFGHDLGRLTQGDHRVGLVHARVDEAPTELGVRPPRGRIGVELRDRIDSPVPLVRTAHASPGPFA